MLIEKCKADDSNWLIRKPGNSGRMRLYCFSYAGGNAATYMQWQSLIDPSVEIYAIQLPGRGNRYAEPPLTSLPELIKQLAPMIANNSHLPFAFFGHSLGGLVAFELARYLQLHQLPVPFHLFVSGCHAPQQRNENKHIHTLPDEELIAVLKDYNGTPPHILAHRELMAMVLPAIRADFSLSENYRYQPGLLLTCPIAVLAGYKDDHQAPEQLTDWQKETGKPCEIQWFDGDHFFIESERKKVIDYVNAKLTLINN